MRCYVRNMKLAWGTIVLNWHRQMLEQDPMTGLRRHRSIALTRLQSRWMTSILYAGFSMLVVAIGAIGLADVGRPRTMWERGNLHALFALLVCAVVLARCRWCVQHAHLMPSLDRRELSRHLSRIVYLFLYAVLAARQGAAIADGLWGGGASHFSLLDERFRGPDNGAFYPKDDFQLFIVSGLSALAFARVLVSRMWPRDTSVEALAQSRQDP
jgi:hypothetical protein